MKIQKGIVKYKDRDDIVCTYGETDSKQKFYFIELDGAKRLSNGNIIASTELVEAIDPMFKAKHVGVIDGSGKEVIPFVHRVIRPINDDILLAELAEPVSESVKEANRTKNDSTPNVVVATASAIKEKMNAKMGADGRFVLNDQFSDATIYDINGNNLVNKEFYSFVGVSGDKLYLCKNTPESEIVEFPLTAEAAKEETPIDVSEVQVPQEVVEKALVKSVDETVAAEPVAPASEEVKVEESILPPIEETPVEEVKAEENVPAVEEVMANNAPAPAAAVFDYFASPAQNAAVGVDNVAPPVIPIAEENLPQAEKAVSEEISLPPVDEAPVEAPVAEEVKAEEPVVPVAEEPKAEEVVLPPVEGKSPLEIAMAADPNQEFPIPIEEPKVEEPVAPVEEAPVAETPVAEAPVEAPVAEEVKVEEPVAEVPVVEEAKAEEVALPPVEEAPVEEIPVAAPVEGSLLPKPEAVAPTEEELIEQETGGDLIDRSLQGIVVETPENEIDESDHENVDLDEKVEDSSLDDLFLEHEDLAEEDEDRFVHSVVHTDRIEDVDVDDFDMKYSDPVAIDDEDTIMTDVAKSMGALIKQNKELKNTLTTTEEKLGKVLASRRNLADKSNMQEKKIEVLTSKLRSLDANLSKLEAKYQSLEAKNLDQERIIESQAHELEVMRPQLQGKEDLVQLLADAQVILGDDDSYSYKRAA